ncbi:hypothetical protein DSO57_1003854 [Entomophthora muscae]|uniref:Uncharacterized protein n=1 Tax=Entomophthora muscae TaxID=34485 RepID=A0ACC2RN53_9FUNG|nr:hypothetical protein DSO57_1003854 [Entomophthora muscae]
MNNPKSVLYGWGVLTAAGAFAYYIAKKDINASRKQYSHKQEKLTWDQKIARDEQEAKEREAAQKQASIDGTTPNKSSAT